MFAHAVPVGVKSTRSSSDSVSAYSSSSLLGLPFSSNTPVSSTP